MAIEAIAIVGWRLEAIASGMEAIAMRFLDPLDRETGGAGFGGFGRPASDGRRAVSCSPAWVVVGRSVISDSMIDGPVQVGWYKVDE